MKGKELPHRRKVLETESSDEYVAKKICDILYEYGEVIDRWNFKPLTFDDIEYADKGGGYIMRFEYDDNTKEASLTHILSKSPEVIDVVTIPGRIFDYSVTKINLQFSYIERSPKKIASVILPDTLKSIGKQALRDFNIESITIPESVMEIQNEAFQFSKLNRIFISQSVTSIGKCAFEDCENLTSIIVDSRNPVYDSRNNCNAIVSTKDNILIAGCKTTQIPQSIEEIGDNAFDHCDLLKINFPDSLKKIGKEAFCCCYKLTQIFIPENTSQIASGCFSDCWRLASIKVSKQNRFYDSRNDCNAIIETATNTLIQGCYNTLIPGSITKIGAFAFGGCGCLSSIIIPNKVTAIGAHAFSRCYNLKEIVLPDSVLEIGAYAFSWCYRLEEIVLPDNILKVDKNAFNDCYGLKRIIINDPTLLEDLDVVNDVEIISPIQQLKKTLKGFWNREISRAEINEIKQEDMKDFYELLNEALSLSQVLNGIKDPDNPFISMEDLFLAQMEYNLPGFYDLSFLKFINIFNDSSQNQPFNLECYLDFVHSVGGTKKLKKGKKLITNDRKKVDVGNAMFRNLTEIMDLFHYNGESCPQFEYHIFPMQNVLTDKDFTIRKKKGRGFNYGNDIYRLTKDYKTTFEKLLRSIDKCYDKSDNGLTHYLFFTGSPRLKKNTLVKRGEKYFYETSNVENDLWKYSPFAVVGIDCRKKGIEYIKVFIQYFQSFLEQLSIIIGESVYGYKLHQTAVVASIAQAMIRNTSHNWSHVSNNYTSDNTYERFSDDYIRQNLNSYMPLENESQAFPKEKNLQLPYFIQYQNNRQNYLSEMTFETHSILTTKWFYGDVIKELDHERVLLNHISGVSGFCYGFSLKYNGAEMNNANDLAVALPDVLGNQALFNILENIIRNTAKHSSHGNERVTISLEFKESPRFPEYYCLEIDNGVIEEDIDKLVSDQNAILNESVLDENYKLRNFGLGLLEMTVAAAFLRQIEISKITSFEYRFEPDDDMFNKQNNLILLKAINKNRALGYRLFLQKPKEMLLIGEWDVEESKKKALTKCGIRIVGADGFVNEVMKGKSFEHPFLLYQKNVCEKAKELLSDDSDCKTLLPIRKLEMGVEEIGALTAIIQTYENNEMVSQLKDFVWSRYYENVISKDLKNPDNGQLSIVKAMRTGAEKNSGWVSNQVVFLDHSDVETHAQCWSMAKESYTFEAWIENLSTKASSKLPNFAAYSVGKNKPVKNYIDHIKGEGSNQTAYEIFEAYHNKVLVLDERIQKFSKVNFEGGSNEDSGPIPCSALFESTNVHIPDVPLDPNAFDPEAIAKIERFINDNMANSFILIHYGVLERMYKKESLITEKLNTWAKNSKRIVVTSGRGSHSLPLPHSVCFANLSSVLYVFTENRNKCLINNLFNQSRRKNG